MRVHPEVVEVMREVGIDLLGQVPRKVDSAMLGSADLVISMGCDDPAVCEYPGRSVEDWGIEDPAGKSMTDVRRIRDLLRGRVQELVGRLDRHGAGHGGGPAAGRGAVGATS